MSVANGGAIVGDMVYLVLSDRLVGLRSVDFPVGRKSLSDPYFMYPDICTRQRTRNYPGYT